MSQNTNKRIAWNDPDILVAAGTNPDAVRALLKKYNQPVPTTTAVYQWTSRRSIPNHWRPSLVYAVLAERTVTTNDLFRYGSAARKQRHRTRNR